MSPPSLSVLIPVLNESATLERLLDAVEDREEVSELIIVDDGSTDATPTLLAGRDFTKPAKIITHRTNQGKGAAIRTALSHAASELALVQDADLEYDPQDYPLLLKPFEHSGVDVVFGVRTFGSHSAYSYWYVLGNRCITLWLNIVFNCYVTDVMTCFKVMPVDLWRALDLRANGFDLETEVSAKLVKLDHRVYQVPISYVARSRDEGKKIGWRDGLKAIASITRIRLSRGPGPPSERA